MSSPFLPLRICSITVYPYMHHYMFQDCKQRKTQLESSICNKNNHKMLSKVKYKCLRVFWFFGFSSQRCMFIPRRNKSWLPLDKFHKQNSDSLFAHFTLLFFPLQVFPRWLRSCLQCQINQHFIEKLSPYSTHKHSPPSFLW